MSAAKHFTPLSSAQRRLWILHQLAPDSPASNRPLALRLTGHLDRDVLRQALETIVSRHDVLRSVFPEHEGVPYQAVLPSTSLDLPWRDLTHLARDEREHAARSIAQTEAARPFDLTTGPVLRVMLLALADDDHVLLLLMHHIVFDGWSEGVLIRELRSLYAAFVKGLASPLPDLPIRYSDFAIWQHQQLDSDKSANALRYWRAQLANLTPLALPTDRWRTDVAPSVAGRFELRLPRELSDRLRMFCRLEGVTLFMAMLSVFFVLLARYTRQSDVAVGAPIAGRVRADVEGLIGCFMNTLVLRADARDQASFRQFMLEVRDTALQAYEHQQLPFDVLVATLAPARQQNRWPLFQILFHLRNLPAQATEQASELQISRFSFEDEFIAGLDLSVEVTDVAGELTCHFKYAQELFDDDTIRRLADHYLTLLESAITTPELPLLALPILSALERQRTLTEHNTTARALPETVCLHQLFEAQVRATPDRIAVVQLLTDPRLGDSQRQCTYVQLDRAANQLAHRLRERGAGVESLVAICVERSIDMVVGVLGILKAGGAYLPIDPAHPQARIEFILADSGASLLLTQSHLATATANYQVDTIFLDTPHPSDDEHSHVAPLSGVRPINSAYAIYTSGSTGDPKAALIGHRSVVNHLTWRHAYFPLNPADRLLQKAPLTFDDSVWEIFEPLSRGARLILAPPGAQQDSGALLRIILEHSITACCFVPAMLESFLEEPGSSACRTLRRVTTGGEALSLALVERFFARLPDCEFYNGYGPTETTIAATFWKCDPHTDRVRIGRPIANTTVHILDELLQPVPVGVGGQLCIGGVGLARGYLNRPALTAEKFIADPFSSDPSSRLFLTGDLARRLADGSIEFLGRIDRQIKLRGYRIEPGEIESALLRSAQVREAVVVVHRPDGGDAQLVAYVVPTGADSSSPETANNELADRLRAQLKLTLPAYMIPTTIIRLERMPLTNNGKIDTAALPAPVAIPATNSPAARQPLNDREQTLARIWAEVLGLAQVNANDDFFELGGHSLSAMRIVSRIRSEWDIELPLARLFETPTVAELAIVCDQCVRSITSASD